MTRKCGDKSLSFTCGLTFYISAIKNLVIYYLSEHYSNIKIDIEEIIFLTAFIEVIIADVFEEARKQCNAEHRVRITKYHLYNAVTGIDLKDIVQLDWIGVDESNRRFHTWSYKVLKQVAPDCGLTNEASKCVDSIICNFVKKTVENYYTTNNKLLKESQDPKKCQKYSIEATLHDMISAGSYRVMNYFKEGEKSVLKYKAAY